MDWPTEDAVEFRLTRKRTPDGGVVFWVRDAEKARDSAFLHRILMAETKNLPLDFLLAISDGERDAPFKLRWESLPGGACELHMDAPPLARE